MTNRYNKYRKFVKNNNPKSGKEIFRRLFFFIFGIAMSGSACLLVNSVQAGMENYMYAQIAAPIEQIEPIEIAKEEKPALELEAKAAYALRVGAAGREKIIYRKNEEEIYPIASLTKLMTATVILEDTADYDLDRPITISETAAAQYDVPVFGNLLPGQVYTGRDLMKLMLFYSSNDAAYALAEVIGVPQFTDKMNSKAQNLGLVGTEFYNPHGLDREDGLANHATAFDLVVLAKYIIGNHPEIFDYSSQSGTYLTENGIFDLKFWEGNSLVGGKTGFTEKAGGCMVVVFNDESGRKYIDVILGAATPETRVEQMQKLINYTNNFAQSLAQKK